MLTALTINVTRLSLQVIHGGNRYSRGLASLSTASQPTSSPEVEVKVVAAADDAPTALIFSDRLDGIIPTIGSMV